MHLGSKFPWSIWGARDGAMVRALASHQCGPGSTPGVDAICGLSLLLLLSFAPRGFSPVTPVFPSTQKPTLPNSNSIWNSRTRLNEFIWTPRCFVGKQAILQFFFIHFQQHFQINAFSMKTLSVVWTNGLNASKCMRFQTKTLKCSQDLVNIYRNSALLSDICLDQKGKQLT